MLLIWARAIIQVYMATNKWNHWHKACHTPVRKVSLYLFQLLLIEPLPVDIFTTTNNNKLRHLRKTSNEEQDEATFHYILFVMSMVIAQTQFTKVLLVAMIMERRHRRLSPSTWVTTLGKNLEHVQNAKSNYQSNSLYTSTFSATINRVISGS